MTQYRPEKSGPANTIKPHKKDDEHGKEQREKETGAPGPQRTA